MGQREDREVQRLEKVLRKREQNLIERKRRLEDKVADAKRKLDAARERAK